ncbi:hypothetical protein GH733_002171 [Mirounga leonina]|nr:hypothetical protein GH733_002171 [Mirounga leonina]
MRSRVLNKQHTGAEGKGDSGPFKDGMITFTLHLKSYLPPAIRTLILQKKPNIRNVSGMAGGLRPASVVVLHQSLAPAFEKFCQANSGPLPLLGLRKPGTWPLPVPNTVLDPTTGCPQFQKYEFGACMGSLTSLEDYTEPLEDMVAFFVDCGFSPEAALEKVGLPRGDSARHGLMGAYKCAGLTVMTNLKDTKAPVRCLTPEGIAGVNLPPEVHRISQDPLHYSMASASAVQKIRELETIIAIDPGVSDGGNELGMGKVEEAVKRHIRNGDVIAYDAEADFAVITGVSNWGGYALACALYILNSCEVHQRYLRKAVGPSRAPGEQNWTQALPSVAKEEKMLGILVRHKVRSGVSGVVGMEVDGLPFRGTHAQMVQKLVDVATVCV